MSSAIKAMSINSPATAAPIIEGAAAVAKDMIAGNKNRVIAPATPMIKVIKKVSYFTKKFP